MHVLHELGVEPVARGAAVAGVRTRPRHEDADDDRDKHERARDVGRDGVPARDRPHPRSRCRVHAGHQHGREGDQHGGREEMQAHDVRVEVREHRDAADDRLQGHIEPDAERQPEQVPALAAQAHDEEEGDHGHDDQDERQHAVAEFDDPVDAHLRRRDERSVRAARPGRAAEARSGQPHEAAGGDDADLHREGRPRRDDDTTVHPIGQPPPETAERAGAGLNGGLRGHRVSPPGGPWGCGGGRAADGIEPVESRGWMTAPTAPGITDSLGARTSAI